MKPSSGATSRSPDQPVEPALTSLYVGRPNVGDQELFAQLVGEMFERRWFTNNGQLVQRFEREICEYLQVKHCVAVCNATVGLEMVYRALDLQGEVIVPAYTFVATVHAASWVGLKPIFVEPDSASHNLDPARLEQAIGRSTAAIVGVHLWGAACDTAAIETIAARYRLPVVYDAAHAFGCWHRGRPVGSFGSCEVFSFHATKFFNTFEGGAITTEDDRLAERLRQARNFGFTGPDRVQSLGTNGKMTEVCAAMGIANLRQVERFIQINRRNHGLYRERLGRLSGVRLLDYSDQGKSNWQYIVIEIDAESFGATRDQVHEALHAAGIAGKRYFYPGCHRMEPYRSQFPEWLSKLPLTDALCQRVLCLPNGTAVSDADIHRVCAVIEGCADRGE